MIKFNNVTAVYNNGSGIFDVTFEIQKSELVFLMGPTGSGKSTVLKTIYKELEMNKGEIHINDKSISNLNRNGICSLRRDIGMIFQDFRLLDDRNVYDNIALPLLIANYSKKDINDKVLDILNVVVHLKFSFKIFLVFKSISHPVFCTVASKLPVKLVKPVVAAKGIPTN